MTSSNQASGWTEGSDLLLADATVPEYLPGEPKRGPKPASYIIFCLLLRAPAVTLLAALTAFLWPFYLLGSLIRGGRPPNVPPLDQFIRYLRLVWSVRPGPPGSIF